MVDYRPQGCNDKGIRGNCGIVALAALTGIDYHVVEAQFGERFEKGPNWKGASNRRDRVAYLKDAGFKVTAIKAKGSVKNVCRALSPNKKYMLRTDGHAMAYINGYLVDQRGTWEPTDPKRANERVSHAHLISKKRSKKMNLNNMTMAQLTELHNKHAATPVTRFATKSKAIERTQAVLPKEEPTQVGRVGNKYPVDAELEWLVANPKRNNSASGQRAAAYWGAATVGE